MHAKHSRQWPIIEGLVLGLRVVFKIHRLTECDTPYGPRIFSSGSFQCSLSSYRILRALCTRKERRTITATRGLPWGYGEQEAERALEES